VLESCVDANLANPETDRGHRLPIVRLKPTLNPPELKSCDLSRIGRETTQIFSGRPEPDHGLLSHVSLYKYQHEPVNWPIAQPAYLDSSRKTPRECAMAAMRSEKTRGRHNSSRLRSRAGSG
jgi:hypothetical protein